MLEVRVQGLNMHANIVCRYTDYTDILIYWYTELIVDIQDQSSAVVQLYNAGVSPTK